MMQLLRDLNKYDLLLYEFALVLAEQRMNLLQSDQSTNRNLKSAKLNVKQLCNTDPPTFTTNDHNFYHRNRKLEQQVLSNDRKLPKHFRHQVGLFQPPGHKGPL